MMNVPILSTAEAVQGPALPKNPLPVSAAAVDQIPVL